MSLWTAGQSNNMYSTDATKCNQNDILFHITFSRFCLL